MPIYTLQGPDGKTYEIEGPAGATAEQLAQVIQSQPKPQDAAPQEKPGGFMQGAGNLAAGALRGAGSIGATIMAPIDMAKDAMDGKGLSLESNRQRRQDMDAGLEQMGAQPDSWMYKGGKLVGEIAGTAGAGGAIAKPLAGIAPRLASSITSGGFNIGQKSGSAMADALLRGAGGAIQGGAQAAMVDPSSAGTGAAIGAVTPGIVKAAGSAGNALSGGLETGAKKLMQSALKPTIEQLRKGKAAIAVDTLLDEGLNATRGGVEQLRTRVGDVNNEVAQRIANSTATVDKQKIIDALRSTSSKFATQVNPTADLAAIKAAGDDFAAHPMIAGNNIPVQLAQQLKQGTYKTLSGKYGEVGSASTEAQKALARGLKDEIAGAVPEVAGLNARESALLQTLEVAERRALMDANKNPMGLAALSQSPASWAMFMADKSALFKSLAARLANQASKTVAPPKQLPNFVQQHGLLGAPSVAISSP